MTRILILLLLGSITAAFATETSPSENTLIEERLIRAAEQLSITIFLEVPERDDYLNFYLTNNAPHKLNLSSELTKVIREWNPRLLILDPTSPYYFSNLANNSLPHEHHNLLYYLRAIDYNTTLVRPFVSVLPQSYRTAVPLFPMLRCKELAYPSSSLFFNNVELIVGPGQAELSFQRESNTHSRLYCSLYGRPHFVLVNQTKQPAITFDAQTLLSYKNIADVDFIRTTLAPGTCLHVPSDWVTGIQLNNSISMVFTLKKVERPEENAENEFIPLPCTEIKEISLNQIDFVVRDTFNVSQIGLLVYFYQYLNPPTFDRQHTPATFLAHIQSDRNLTQFIMKWTPELITLIHNDLFKQLDMNQDGQFNGDDYFALKQTQVEGLHQSIYGILEKLREIVVSQYNEFNATISQMTQQLAGNGLEQNLKETLEAMIDQLPDEMKARLKEQNIDIQTLLGNLDTNQKRPKRSSNNKQRSNDDDTKVLFDTNELEEILEEIIEDEEEEITAEPLEPPPTRENQTQRTEL